MRKTGFSAILGIFLLIFSTVFTLPASATVTVETVKNVYAGSGTAGPFTYAFKIWTSADLRVIKTDTAGVETTLVLNTDYTVTGAGVATGGTVTLTAVLPAGYTLTLIRDMDYLQGTSFTAGQAISATSVNQALDKLEHQIQQLAEQTGRAFQVPRSSQWVRPPYLQPDPQKLIGWNSTGDGLQNYSMETVSIPTIDDIGNHQDDLSAAVSDINVNRQLLMVPKGITLTASTTTPENIDLWVPAGGQITLGDYDLAIHGPFRGSPGCFVQNGTGRVTFGNGSTDRVLSEWWGAVVGSGKSAPIQAANALAIQAALDAVPSGGTVFFMSGVYEYSSAITQFNQCNLISSGKAQLYYTGTTGYPLTVGQSSSLLTTTSNGAVLKAAKTITLTDVTDIAAGDIIRISDSSAQWPYVPTAGIYYGELNRVKSVDAGTKVVTLEVQTASAYATASDITVIRPYKSISVKGLTFTRAASSNALSGLVVGWTDGASVEDCHFENYGSAGLVDFANVGLTVKNCTFRNLYWSGVDLGYGIQVDESIYTTISDCRGFNCRRLVDFSGAIPSRYGLAIGCVAQGDYTSTAGSSGVTGFGTHGASEFITFQNCDTIGIYNGFQVRGGNVKISGCNGYNITGTYIVHNAGNGLSIDNCRLTGYALASGTNPYPANSFLDVTSPGLGLGKSAIWVKNCIAEIYGNFIYIGALVPATTINISNTDILARASSLKLVTTANLAAPTTYTVRISNVSQRLTTGAAFAFANTLGTNATVNVVNATGELPIYADNAAALAGGLVAGDGYRTGGDPDITCVVH